MKTCRMCNVEKPIIEFPKLKRSSDGYNSMCKLCKREYDNAYYARTPDRPQAIRRSNKVAIDRNRKFVWEYYSTHPCVDCGESDPIVLEFDHLHDKIANVSKLANSAATIETITAEIDKCVVRCANCHRRKTAQQFGWYQYVGSAQ